MPVTFLQLWAVHPANSGIEAPCTDAAGEPNFENQCAIKMGLALQHAGISLSAYPKTKCCWFGHDEKHVLRAEELAAWLKNRPAEFGTVERSKHTSVAAFKGRRGIVMCRNFWGKGMQGDHLDLWNGAEFADGEPDYFERSQEVWFWELA
jgi:Type VI secretion system (T6SS), amidase effector protein 4